MIIPEDRQMAIELIDEAVSPEHTDTRHVR